jgi:excisionase family DNA binding protein
MFGSFLPSLWSLSNQSLLGSRSRHCYAIKWFFAGATPSCGGRFVSKETHSYGVRHKELFIGDSGHRSMREIEHSSRETISRPLSDDSEPGQLLTVVQVAYLLRVPPSWVYDRTRQRSMNRIPGFRLGKYWRFRKSDILTWIEKQRSGIRTNA